MIAQFLVQESKPGSDYFHAVRRGLSPGSLYVVDHVKDYGWYKSIFLTGFKGGFNSDLFNLYEGVVD